MRHYKIRSHRKNLLLSSSDSLLRRIPRTTRGQLGGAPEYRFDRTKTNRTVFAAKMLSGYVGGTQSSPTGSAPRSCERSLFETEVFQDSSPRVDSTVAKPKLGHLTNDETETPGPLGLAHNAICSDKVSLRIEEIGKFIGRFLLSDCLNSRASRAKRSGPHSTGP